MVRLPNRQPSGPSRPENPLKNSLILLAAGQGKRMGGKTPKMFLKLLGRPILHWTLHFLDLCPAVQNIVLVVPPGTRQKFDSKKIHAVIAGGRERTDSARLAMRALPKEAEWVGIHDAARPFVAPGDVARVFQAAQDVGAAILAVPAKDTVKLSRQGSFSIEQTLRRERCWLAQTPQVFRRDIAEKMHASSRSKRFTDDASIAESLGYSVRLVPGSYENMKITTPEDLVLAEKILKKRIRHGK